MCASSLSRVRLFVTLWTVARQASLSMALSRPEYWSGVPFPSPEDLPNPGIEPRSPVLQVDSSPFESQGKLSKCLTPNTSGDSLPVMHTPQSRSAQLLFRHSVVSDCLHGLQHARLLCPPLSPEACSTPCPSSRLCRPAITSSVVPFSSRPQSFPASGSFQ